MRPQIVYDSTIPHAFWPKRSIIVYPDGRQVAGPIKEMLSAVCRSLQDCQDIPYWLRQREDLLPEKPILLLIPGVFPPPVVAGLGFSTAEELRDAALEVWSVKTGKIERFGDVFDWDDIRDREGRMRKEDVAEAVAYAFSDRIAKHKASPITDPWKQFQYPNPTAKVSFPSNPPQGWKGES